MRYPFDVDGAIFFLFVFVRGRDTREATVDLEEILGDPGIVAAEFLAQDVIKELHLRSRR